MSRTDLVDTLNSLLRGEISAVETYRIAIGKLEADAPGRVETSALRLLRDDHVEAANVLKRFVLDRGGENATASGAWGTFVKAVEGAAKALGTAAALKALQEGEEHGIADYERALEDEDLDDEARRLIADVVLPRARRHPSMLEDLAEKARRGEKSKA